MAHSRPGLAKITTLLHRRGVERVGTERGDGPVVEHLIREEFEVVVISARQVKSPRARYGSAGNKDDRLGAFVVADALRTDAGRWARGPTGEPGDDRLGQGFDECAADQVGVDLAVPVVRSLMRPEVRAAVPASLRVFAPALAVAGLLPAGQ